MSDQMAPAERTRRPAVPWASRVVLVLVAVAGAVLSFRSLYVYAVPAFGPVLAVGVPIGVDLLIAGSALAFIASVHAGRPRRSWRWIAHGAVAGTVVLNALASPDLAGVPLHVAGPIVWSVLVEQLARDSTWTGAAPVEPVRIPLALWVTAPVESWRTVVQLARQSGYAQARLEVGLDAAAREALRLALPGRRHRCSRAIVGRRLRSGTVTPAAVLAYAVDVMGQLPARDPRRPARDVLATMLASSTPAAQLAAPTSPSSVEPVQLELPGSADRDPVPVRVRPVASAAGPDLADQLGERTGRSAIRWAASVMPGAGAPDVRRALEAAGVPVSDRECRRVLAELAAAADVAADVPAGPVRLTLAGEGVAARH